MHQGLLVYPKPVFQDVVEVKGITVVGMFGSIYNEVKLGKGSSNVAFFIIKLNR